MYCFFLRYLDVSKGDVQRYVHACETIDLSLYSLVGGEGQSSELIFVVLNV